MKNNAFEIEKLYQLIQIPDSNTEEANLEIENTLNELDILQEAGYLKIREN